MRFFNPPHHQDFLEEAPMSWDALVKKTFRKKEEILPMQMAEVRRLFVPKNRTTIQPNKQKASPGW